MSSQVRRTASQLCDAALGGERRAVGQLLTLIEQGDAREIDQRITDEGGHAHVIGITGAPGAGKSTLVGRLVENLVGAGRQPAVLAVDPSSPLSGGAILGDRIRIDEVVEPGRAQRGSFVRSMATRGHSGGLALAVPRAVRLIDACGFDPVIVETVGVGQVEVDVVSAADTTVVVMTPGMGDAVQANKAGLLEVADIFVVNKADRDGAASVRRDLELMLDLSHMTGRESQDHPRAPILMSNARSGEGVDELSRALEQHLVQLSESGRRELRREERAWAETRACLIDQLTDAADRAIADVRAATPCQSAPDQRSPQHIANDIAHHLVRHLPVPPPVSP